jgi:hypothetical protein
MLEERKSIIPVPELIIRTEGQTLKIREQEMTIQDRLLSKLTDASNNLSPELREKKEAGK